MQLLRKFVRTLKTLRRYTHYWVKARQVGHSQSDESQILVDLMKQTGAPHTFIEFGFHPYEFNCIGLRHSARGLLVDGDVATIRLAQSRFVLPKNIEVANLYLTLDNLDFIRTKFNQLGILSIDVDGNDYWFLEALIGIKPTIICVEYNASFGNASITVPYDSSFNRHKKHPSGWYHGASLTALAKLCATHDYGLAAISSDGLNAFFTLTGSLDSVADWRPNLLREKWSGKTQMEQWDAIKSMPFVEI